MSSAATITSPPTSPFSPPSSCWSTIYRYTESSDMWVQIGPAPTVSPSCYPPNYVEATDFFYSPSVQCPVGYTTALQNTVTLGDVTETRATCCPPSDFVWQPDKTGNVYYSTLGCTMGGAPTFHTSLPVNVGGTVTGTGTWGIGLNAYSVQVRWQKSDLVEATLQISTSSGPPPSSIEPSTFSISPIASSAAVSGGMSIGAKSGIAVAASFCGIAALILVLVWVYRMGRRFAPQPAAAQPCHDACSTSFAQSQYTIEELEAEVSNEKYELDGRQLMQELSGNDGVRSKVELMA